MVTLAILERLLDQYGNSRAIVGSDGNPRTIVRSIGGISTTTLAIVGSVWQEGVGSSQQGMSEIRRSLYISTGEIVRMVMEREALT
ncbi:hypothetical protein SDJN03_00681, partial [Cucurbita argyrosperma subsp. sororia]